MSPIESKSLEIKRIVEQYNIEAFISEIAILLSYLGEGPIPFSPFHQLHSPLRQLFYLGALNICSKNENRVEYNIKKHDKQWNNWHLTIKILQELDIEYEKVFFNLPFN